MQTMDVQTHQEQRRPIGQLLDVLEEQQRAGRHKAARRTCEEILLLQGDDELGTIARDIVALLDVLEAREDVAEVGRLLERGAEAALRNRPMASWAWREKAYERAWGLPGDEGIRLRTILMLGMAEAGAGAAQEAEGWFAMAQRMLAGLSCGVSAAAMAAA